MKLDCTVIRFYARDSCGLQNSYSKCSCLTQDVHHSKTVVECHADDESAQTKSPKVADPSRGHAANKTQRVGTEQGRHPAVPVSYPTENQSSNNSPHEENSLRNGRQRRVLAHPIQL